MRRLIIAVFLILTLCLASIPFISVHAATFQGWQVENGGGQYSQNNGVMNLSGAGGTYVILYEQIEPTTDFNFSLQVNAATLQGFAIMLRSSLPFAGSTQGVNFEFGARDGGSFSFARYASAWTWNVFASGITQNVNYTMILSVDKDPFSITATVLHQNGTSLASYVASDMTNLAFNNTNYLGFGVLESGGNYTVRNISGANIPIPSRQWVVDGYGTGDFTSIQAAINSAYPGDSIYVKNATYYEHLTINKTLTMLGENKQTTIIDGGAVNPASVIVVNADNVAISGFTIQNARSGGSAIWVEGFNSTRIDNNIISNNGDGIRVLHSYGNLILNNVVKENPYTAIGFNWAFNNTVQNNTIVGNYIGIGGGFEPCYDNIFFGNNFTSNSIGVQVDFSNSKFYHNVFSGNSKQVDVYTSNFTASWDDGFPSGGNYWSDYAGQDSNGDGIGDTPYIIDANNKDNYPLINQDWWKDTLVDFALSPTPAIIGQTVELSGNLADRLGQPLNDTKVEVYVNGTFITSLYSNSSGEFSTSGVIASFGTYVVGVKYEGSTYYRPSSKNETLTVYQTMPTNVAFTLTPNPAKVGESVTLKGNLTDNSNPMPYAPLELWVKRGSGPWDYIVTLYTSNTGWVQASGTIGSVGIYQVAIVYRGTSQYLMSYKIETLTVHT